MVGYASSSSTYFACCSIAVTKSEAKEFGTQDNSVWAFFELREFALDRPALTFTLTIWTDPRNEPSTRFVLKQPSTHFPTTQPPTTRVLPQNNLLISALYHTCGTRFSLQSEGFWSSNYGASHPTTDRQPGTQERRIAFSV